MTTDRQIKAVAEAIKIEERYLRLYGIEHQENPYSWEECMAMKAIEASDAKYVPMLVEALSDAHKKFESLQYVSDITKILRDFEHIKETLNKTLAQLPKEAKDDNR